MWLILISQTMSQDTNLTACSTLTLIVEGILWINLAPIGFLGGWLWLRTEKHAGRSPFCRLFCSSNLVLAGCCWGLLYVSVIVNPSLAGLKFFLTVALPYK